MRILLVTHFYPGHGGGIERVAEQLARRMTAMGHDLTWAASDVDPSATASAGRALPMRCFNGIERLTGFPYPLWSPGSLRQLARAVHQADAVHVHDAIYAGSLAAAWLARRYRKPLVVTQHIGEVPLPPHLRPLLGLANRLGAWAVLKRASGVAFISPAVRQVFERLTGPQPTYAYVPNGVDTSIFHATHAPRAELKAALGLDPAHPLMLFVGRFVPKKRLPIVREMAACRPGWQWCVIGQGPEQPAHWGLANVHVPGALAQTRVADYCRAADLLVLPSEGEGFPLVVQEAMACGLPACITPAVASGATLPADCWLPLPEVTGDRAATVAAGLRAIDAWLAQPATLLAQQRARCAAYAADTWDWSRAVQQHLAMLNPIAAAEAR